MTKTRIGVVRGGPSDEYDISLKTGTAVLLALNKEKYDPLDIHISKSGAWHIQGVEVKPYSALRRADAVFNALHGSYGEDGKIQQLFETHGIPFTGSDSLSSAMTMAKHVAKEVYRREGLKTPLHVLVQKADDKEPDIAKILALVHSKFSLPYVIKPASGGSSLGVALVTDRAEFAGALRDILKKHGSVIIEEFIPGIEATVGVIKGFRGQDMYALPPIEIRKSEGHIFGYVDKYGGENDVSVQDASAVVRQAAQEIVPATFSSSIKKELERLAIIAHTALGLSQYSRSDFIVSPRRGIFVLETNSLPGLTDGSLVPKALNAVGSSVKELVEHLIDLTVA